MDTNGSTTAETKRDRIAPKEGLSEEPGPSGPILTNLNTEQQGELSILRFFFFFPFVYLCGHGMFHLQGDTRQNALSFYLRILRGRDLRTRLKISHLCLVQNNLQGSLKKCS